MKHIIGSSTPSKGNLGTKDKERILHTHQKSRTGTSPPDAGYCYILDILFGEVILFWRGYSLRILSLSKAEDCL